MLPSDPSILKFLNKNCLALKPSVAADIGVLKAKPQYTFSKLDKALNGTADRMTIMEQANNAMLLGIAESDDQMAEMFDVAQRLGRALGKDAASSVESLITGIGRQSRLMLDNLGIVVKTEEAYKEYAKELKVSV